MRFWLKRTSDTSIVIHTEDPGASRMFGDPGFHSITAQSAPYALDRFQRWERGRQRLDAWSAVLSFFNGDDATTAGLRRAGFYL